MRHIYDLHQLLQQLTLRTFLASADFIILLADARTDDARNQEFQGDWATRLLRGAQLYADEGRLWQQLIPTYQGIFRQLVHGSLSMPAAVAATLATVGQRLTTLDEPNE